jgi:hypothetical protein
MENELNQILGELGIVVDKINETNGLIIEREQLLSDEKYDNIKILIPELKKNYSSSFLTCLQKNADKNQKWPLLNLVRQLLNVCNFKMVPIRKADGYTLEGVKKYKRYFQIIKKSECKNNENTVDK